MAKRTIIDKQWFVVYTKPHIERKVSEILTRKKIENYFPLNRIVGDWNVNKKIIDEPLFVGLVVMTIVTIGASGPLMRYFILKQEGADAKAKLPAELPVT